jgi:hypothetical protein
VRPQLGASRRVTEIYDDIEHPANQPVRIDHLYWRAL